MKRIILSLLSFTLVAFTVAQEKTDTLRQRDLGEVIITGSRTETLLKNSPEIIQVVGMKEIQLLKSSSLADILSLVPGVSIEGGTGSGFPKRSIFSINGFPGSNNLILVNGVRLLTDHIQTGQNMEFIPAEFIERIEIIKGSASAQYGSDALGGIVNIITARCRNKPELSVYSTIGSYHTYTAGITILTPVTKKLRVSSFTGWEKSDGAAIIAPAHRVGKMNYERLVTMNNLDFEIGRKTSGNVYLNLTKNKMLFSGVNKYGFLFNPGISIKHQILKSLDLTVNVAYVHWESEQNNEKNQLIQPELMFNFSGLKNNTMLVGTDFRQNYFLRVSTSSHKQYIGGLFIQDEYHFCDKFSSMIALRLDKAENLNAVFSPKVSLLYKPLRQFNIRFSAGRGFHAPLLIELYEVAYGHGGSALRFGNPNLKPEYSTSFNLAAEVYPLKDLMFMINGYFSMIDDMIVPVYQGAWSEDTTKDVWMRQNIHKAYVYGAEATMRYKFLNNYVLEAGYNFSKNMNIETSRQLPYSPGSSVFAKFQFEQNIIRHIVISGFIGFKAVFNRSAWDWQPPSGTPHDYQDGLITKLVNYQKLDAGLTLTLFGHYSLFFNTYNILGQEIETLDDAFTVYKGEPAFKGGLKILF